jgi:hypothetical protein
MGGGNPKAGKQLQRADALGGYSLSLRRLWRVIERCAHPELPHLWLEPVLQGLI